MQRHLSPQTAPTKKLRINDSLNDVPLAHTPQVSSSTWPPQPTGVSMRQKRVNMEVLSGSSASAQVTHEAASEGTNVSANSSSASLETSPLPPVIRDRIFEERGKGRWSVTIQLDRLRDLLCHFFFSNVCGANTFNFVYTPFGMRHPPNR